MTRTDDSPKSLLRSIMRGVAAVLETLATIIGKKRTVNATKEELELIDTGAAAYSRGEHLTLDELKDGLDGHRR